MSDNKISARKAMTRREMLADLAILSLSTPTLESRTIGQNQGAHVQKLNPSFQNMMDVAQRLLGLLSPELQRKAIIPFGSDERFKWHYVPSLVSSAPSSIRRFLHERKGVSVKELTSEQRLAAHALLRSALSSQGYLKATGIMYLEEVLRDIEITLSGDAKDFALVRDPELYFFTFFGKPSKDAPWGWRVEGHHLSLNFSLVSGELIATMPAFLGTNPAAVSHGTHAGTRILAAEEDIARELLASLNTQQLSQAIIATTAPRDIITGHNRKADLRALAGLSASKMKGVQSALLMRLIQEYVNNLSYDLADVQLEKIRISGIDKIHLAWAGSTEPGKPHYYRVHSPQILIEYDNTQDNANHIHTVFRDLENDFGVDMLRQHYDKSKQHD